MTTSVEKSKILIVDDNPSNLYAFQAILRDPDLEMLTTTSGEEALQILLEHQDTALILMDVNMPGMDGFETTELIRGQPRFRDIPILFITAVYKSDEFARRGFDVGAFDYITKPVDGEVLESKVNVFLALQKQKRQLAREIAERKQVEEALRESEQWLSTTLRSIGDAVIATDAQGFVTLMNPVAEDLIGWSEAEVVGRPLEDVFNIINEQTGERAESPVGKVLREGVAVGLANHTVLIAKDGTRRSIADSGAPMRDEEGNIIGTVMVFRDITERKRAEEALAQRVQDLESFNRLAVGRELRMIELKRQVNELSEQLGKEPPYDLSLLE